MKAYLLGAVAGVVLALLVCWLLRPNYAELEAESQRLEDSVSALHSRMAVRDSVDQLRVASLAVAQARIAETARIAEGARTAARRAGSLLDSAVAGNANLEDLVARQRSSYEEALAADSTQLAAFAQMVGDLNHRIIARDSTIKELRRGLEMAIDDRDRWRRAARAPLLVRILKTAGTATATALVCRVVPGEARPC